MKITLIVVGKLKSQFREIDDFFQKRIKIYSPLEIIELKERNDIVLETESIIKSIPVNSFVVALRETGKGLDSLAFAKLLSEKSVSHGSVCFVIGGAYGFGDINENLTLSIAPWTLPHQLARINLLEQIYRGLSINSGSGYHHG
ncbi:23S rRNA (pseudouridine(1915)-N(3))-methyltransferase RlmH [bacterium]|jgi:23S rRNA (pseudouridine1915-N3)-methyltransferase|nr:23S rRNA (pseudouridine(1915)-N(3))-methyltransferase RlmH [bacterium]